MPFDDSPFDPSVLTQAQVEALVKSMYTWLDANDKIFRVLSKANRVFVVKSLDMISRADDPEIKANAVEMLVWLERSNAITWVENLLEERDEDLRGAGCKCAAQINSAEAVALLTARLRDDPAGNVRYIAADCLEVVGNAASISALKAAVDSDEGTDFEGRPVKKMASWAIESIEKRERDAGSSNEERIPLERNS